MKKRQNHQESKDKRSAGAGMQRGFVPLAGGGPLNGLRGGPLQVADTTMQKSELNSHVESLDSCLSSWKSGQPFSLKTTFRNWQGCSSRLAVGGACVARVCGAPLPYKRVDNLMHLKGRSPHSRAPVSAATPPSPLGLQQTSIRSVEGPEGHG